MPPARIAIEAGTHSPWVNALLTELGHEVLVANPRKLRTIYDNVNKSDDVDAEQLARFARMDPKLLSPIAHRGMATRADLAILRSRSALVSSHTQLSKNVRETRDAATIGRATVSKRSRSAQWPDPVHCSGFVGSPSGDR